MSEPNERLRLARERTASPTCPGSVMSRQELAEAVNAYLYRSTGKVHELDANYIGKLERGAIRWPGARYREAFRAVLGATIDVDLGFYNTHRRTPPIPMAERDLSRRELLSTAAVDGSRSDAAASAVELLTRTEPAQVPSRIGPGEVEQIAAAADLFTRWDHSYGGGVVREAVMTQLRWSSQLLEVQATSELRTALHEAIGRLGLVSGFMAFDADARHDAERIFQFALACAEAAGNWHLRAKVYSSMARHAIWHGIADTGLTFVEFALVRSDRLTGTERAMLHSARARALAKLGRVQEALRAVGAADEAFAGANPAEDPPWMAYYDAAQHAGDTGHALFDLAIHGHPTEAAHRLASAVAEHEPRYVRSRFLSQAKLASLTMATGDPHEATTIAGQALTLAPRLRSRRAKTELVELQQYAGPYTNLAEVHQLNHRIDRLLAAT